MMVTACSDDQGAICTKAPSLSPLFAALEGKGGPLKEKVGAYMTLSERLKNDKNASLSREISQHTAQLTCIVSVDIMNDDIELTQAALQALGFCMHLPDISRAFTPEDASTIVKALCNALLKTKDKSTCTRALWCLSKQNFPQEIIKSELHSILCTLEHALVQGEFQSMTVEYEAVNVIIRLLEDLPDDMATHAARWGKLLFPLVVHSAHKIRERAACAMDLGLPSMLRHQPEIVPGLVADLKSTLVPEMVKVFASKCEIHVLKMWGNFVTLLGKALHKGGGLINCLLGVVEQGFKNASPDVKLASFVAWRALIDNFALETEVLYNAKRLKLLLQPLKATNAKQELVAQAKLDTWWYLVYRLGPKAAVNFDQVCTPLLQFALGLNTNINGMQCPSTPLAASSSGLRQGFTTPLQRTGSLLSMTSPATPRLILPPGTPGGVAPPVFKSVQLQGVEILARVLGTPSDTLGTVPKYNFTVDKLNHPVITSSTAFIKFSSTLVPMVRDVICNLGDQLDEGLLFLIWYSLVGHVSDMVTTATKKDSVEVLTQFLTSLQCIVGASRLTPKTLLKFLEAVSHLPKNVLGSPSYHAGNAGLMHGTPALYLIELLLSPGLMVTTTDERFFCVLETLIDCGLTVPGTVLGFSGSVLQLIDKAAANLSDKGILWRMWSNMVYPLLGHIIESNEVNQGDSLDHDFSAMYASLMLPVQHLLPSGTLPQMTVKALLKTWAELYQAFARCAAVVTTADSNLGCEELCTKMMASLEKESLNSSCLDALSQILQVIANSLDFSSFTTNVTLNNAVTPGGVGRGRARPLGNLTAFVRLVIRVTEELHNIGKMERSKFAGLQSANSSLASASIGTMANVLSILFTNVSQPSIIEALLDKLAGRISFFYDNSGVYPGPTWQKLEKLWTDLLTSVQTRYGGPYNSVFLATISPLLESGLTHPKRAIKSHCLVFWNATFATVDSLEYPAPLKVCLAKLKEKTPLVLPGWTDTQEQVVNETPISQFQESEASQSLIPPPAVSTIPNFGAPSPQKMHGSFLKRTAQAERLFASSSPERYKNPSPFGKSNKRSVSPGKGLLQGVLSPVSTKGKRDGSPGVGGAAAARRRLHVDEESRGEFVFIAPSPKKTQVLTDHQKEIMRTRRILPALYNDLEQSQDTQTFTEIMSQNEATQDSQVQQDGGATASSEESPSMLSLQKKKTTLLKEALPNAQDGLSVQDDTPTSAVRNAQQSVRGEDGELDGRRTGKAETEKDKADNDSPCLTFAGILGKIKESEDPSSSAALEVAPTTEMDKENKECLPIVNTEAESSVVLKDEPSGSNEETTKTDPCLPAERSEKLVSVTREVKEEQTVQVMEDLKEKSMSDWNVLEDVKEEEEGKEELECKEEQRVLVKDSTDEEEGDAKEGIVHESGKDEFAIPETQQSQSLEVAEDKADDKLIISPLRSASNSRPSDLKLSLTPVIKLQRLKEADLMRLSPDASKCSFAKLDINSSPKVFTSSEEESTPSLFASRLRRLQSDEASRGTGNKSSLKRTVSDPVKAEKVVKHRATRRKNQRSGKKHLQSSQADLAELAERFELDGIEPLADENDMDQSEDQIDCDNQSKQVTHDSVSKDARIPENISVENNGQEKGVKARGKKINCDGKQCTSVITTATDDKIHNSLSESYPADESMSEDSTATKLKTKEQGSQNSSKSEQGEKATSRVPKKRGRKKKTKSTSPVKDASSCQLPTAAEETQTESNKGQKESSRNGSKRSTSLKLQETDAMTRLEVNAQENRSCEAFLRGPAVKEDTPVDEPKDAIEMKLDEKEPLSVRETQEKPQKGSSSSTSDPQDEEGQLNSCDDLFESCPKDIAKEATTKIAPSETENADSKVSNKPTKHSRRLSKNNFIVGKKKCRSWDCENDSEEDNIPLAKIKHCYLDVDSQTSDSEVDFPKKRAEEILTTQVKDVKVVRKNDVKTGENETKTLPSVKTRRSKKGLSRKSPTASPKLSPNTTVAKKILRRVRKSPLTATNLKKCSPGKPVASARVAAKISPMATRLRRSKHLSSLSSSVPSKLTRKSRGGSKGRPKNVHEIPIKRSKFEEKLNEAILNEVGDNTLSDDLEDLWEDLSPVAGLSVSLPLPDSKSLLSPSPVSFLEEEIHEKDLGFTDRVTELCNEFLPAVVSKTANITKSEAMENEEILSSSTVVSDTVTPPAEVMECSDSSSTPLPVVVIPESTECERVESADQHQDAAQDAPLIGCSSPTDKVPLPQSPVIPIKFTPSCHSSPNVSGAARIKLPDQGSPSGSIPAMYSPSGSPSGGILKRKDSASPSPSNKSRRVSFAEPISEHSPIKQSTEEPIPPEPTENIQSKFQRSTHPPSPLVTTTPSKVITAHSKFITTSSRRSSSSGLSARSRVSPSGRRVSPGAIRRRTARQQGFVTPTSGRKIKLIRQSSQNTQGTPLTQCTQQNSLDNSIDSDYDNQESVFPELAECGTPVERVLPQLTSSMWSRGLGQLVRARNILTVGHLCSLSPTEIRSLPIRSPKISNLRKVMTNFQKQQVAKSGTPVMSRKKDEGSGGPVVSEDVGVKTKTAEDKKQDEESCTENQVPDVPPAVATSEQPSQETASTSGTELSLPKQGTKRKHEEVDSCCPQDAAEEETPRRKQAKIVDRLQDLVGEFAAERLAELPSDHLFQAHQHVNSMMESIMAALKVKVKSPSLNS